MQLVQHADLAVKVDACWALSFLAEGKDRQIQVSSAARDVRGREGRAGAWLIEPWLAGGGGVNHRGVIVTPYGTLVRSALTVNSIIIENIFFFWRE